MYASAYTGLMEEEAAAAAAFFFFGMRSATGLVFVLVDCVFCLDFLLALGDTVVSLSSSDGDDDLERFPAMLGWVFDGDDMVSVVTEPS